MKPGHPIAIRHAFEHLAALDKVGASFTFQTFADAKGANYKKLARVVHGPLTLCAERLRRLNEAGAGVFVTINATDGKGRRAKNVKRVRANFVDLDGAPVAPVIACDLPPDLIVESSPGKYHCYWLADETTAGDLEGFTMRQKKLAALFEGDPKVCDLPRVLRLAGFIHRKGEPFRSRIVPKSEWGSL